MYLVTVSSITSQAQKALEKQERLLKLQKERYVSALSTVYHCSVSGVLLRC